MTNAPMSSLGDSVEDESWDSPSEERLLGGGDGGGEVSVDTDVFL